MLQMAGQICYILTETQSIVSVHVALTKTQVTSQIFLSLHMYSLFKRSLVPTLQVTEVLDINWLKKKIGGTGSPHGPIMWMVRLNRAII